MASKVSLNIDGLIRAQTMLANLTERQNQQLKQRALATLVRRLIPEAARQTSANILNLSPRQISPYLTVKMTANGIDLSGSASRLPVSAFKPTWGGPLSRGVTVTFWRDSGPITLEHTFMRKGSKEVWMRVPGTRSVVRQEGSGRDSEHVTVRGASGLVPRLPIVVRKGPSFSRAIFEKKHGDIYPALFEFCRQTIKDEIARLTLIFKRR